MLSQHCFNWYRLPTRYSCHDNYINKYLELAELHAVEDPLSFMSYIHCSIESRTRLLMVYSDLTLLNLMFVMLHSNSWSHVIWLPKGREQLADCLRSSALCLHHPEKRVQWPVSAKVKMRLNKFTRSCTVIRVSPHTSEWKRGFFTIM